MSGNLDRNPFTILIEPVVTEKSLRSARLHNQYTFRVRLDATKPEIRDAVERVFGVKVTKVNTLNAKPKKRGERWRHIRPVGHTPRWKKAVVTVAKGQTLPVYEGLV